MSEEIGKKKYKKCLERRALILEKLRQWGANKTEEYLFDVLGSKGKYEKNREKLSKEIGYSLPKTMANLVSILGGNPKYSVSGEYVVALVQSKQIGQELLKALASGKYEGRKHTNQAHTIRQWGANKTREGLLSEFGTRLKYEENRNALSKELGIDLPKSYPGFIGMLGGNPADSQDGQYVVALIQGKKEGKQLGKQLKKKKKNMLKNRETLTGDKIRRTYYTLPTEVEKKRFKNESAYNAQIDEIREYFGEGMGSTFDWLIPILGGDKDKCRSVRYVKALMISPEEGEKYLNRFLNHKKQLKKEKKKKSAKSK